MQLTFPSGQAQVILTDRQEERLICEAAALFVAARAEQDALAQVYDVHGLMKRLQIGETTAYNLFRTGEIGCVATGGSKGYRTTEYHVRCFLNIPVPFRPQALFSTPANDHRH